MNATEYAQFERDVARFLEDLDGPPSCGFWTCPDCGNPLEGSEPCSYIDPEWEEWPDMEKPHPCGFDPSECEGGFSWSDCDCCGSTLGGDRHHVIGWLKGAPERGCTEDDRWEGEVCSDCVYYFAYGFLES